MSKNKNKKERTISLIKEGTVIDHLDPESVFKIARILDLENCNDQVTIGINMKSPQHKRKGIIKIENRYLTKEDVDKISLFSPYATINIIRDYEVDEKFRVDIPKQVENVLRCNNPNCITNLEGERTLFVLHSEDPLEFICKYCERRLLKEDMEVF